MNIWEILLLILGIMIVLVVLFALGLMMYVIFPPNRKSTELVLQEATEDGHMQHCAQYPKDYTDITTPDGYILHGLLMKQPSMAFGGLEDDHAGHPSNAAPRRFVIVTHGYTDARWAAVKYANIYYDLGYNVFFYDIRYHGDNKKTYCSMGLWESRDIHTIELYLREKYGEDIEIGLHGESLGAASSLLALNYCDDIKFVVADCPFADLGHMLEEGIELVFHLPAKLAHLASWASLCILGYRLDSVKPIEAVKASQVPILYIHGTADTLINTQHSRDMYAARPEGSRLVEIEGADHARSYKVDPVKYCAIVSEFLQSVQDQATSPAEP